MKSLILMTLVFWCGMASGAPAGGDLLTGQDFLAMYMKRQPHYLDHNAIPHKEHQHDFTDIGSAGLEDEEEVENETVGVTENDEIQTTTALEEDSTTTEEPTTLIETTRIERSTTEAEWDQEHPSQVVSVRVSSSVVRKRPEPQEEKAISVSYRVEAKVADSYPSASQTQEKYVTGPKNDSDYARAEALTYHRIDLGTDPQNTPVSYETSVSSASSGSSVRFYREPPSYQYSTQINERQQRNYPIPDNDSIFGQRERPRQKQEQVYPKQERNFEKQEQGFQKQEPAFPKAEAQIFQKPEHQIYSSQEPAYSKPEPQILPKQEEIFQKTEHRIFPKQEVYPKPEQQLYAKQDELYQNPPQYPKQEVYENQNRQYSKPEDVYRKLEQDYNKPEQIYRKEEQVYNKPEQPYGRVEQIYNKPEELYGKPEQVYGKPEQDYGKPEQVYGKPEQVYGKPEQVYGKPEQVYGKPEEVYGKPEQGYEKPEGVYRKPEGSNEKSVQAYGKPVEDYQKTERTYGKSVTVADYPKPEQIYGEPERIYGEPEQNYEVDEAISVATQGRTHGVQNDPKDKHKFGYVVEGHNYRKYRVEEKTADGFIVGEYGVVSHDDGSLRGVRYTADSNINPRLIYDALVKFLSLK